MIRTLTLLVLFASPALADQDCIAQHFPVTDVRIDDSGRIGVDFHNDTSFPVIGYRLFYAFYTDDGVFTKDLPSYMLKQSIIPGAIHTHRMQLVDFDIDMADVSNVKAHVVGVHQDLGVAQNTDTPLAHLLENCEEI